MTKSRDLFRAIVLSGTALTAGCPSSAARDAGADAPTGGEDAPMLADASTDTPATTDAPAPADAPTTDAGEDAFVAIL